MQGAIDTVRGEEFQRFEPAEVRAERPFHGSDIVEHETARIAACIRSIIRQPKPTQEHKIDTVMQPRRYHSDRYPSGSLNIDDRPTT